MPKIDVLEPLAFRGEERSWVPLHVNPVLFHWDVPWATGGATRPCPTAVYGVPIVVGEFVQKTCQKSMFSMELWSELRPDPFEAPNGLPSFPGASHQP